MRGSGPRSPRPAGWTARSPRRWSPRTWTPTFRGWPPRTWPGRRWPRRCATGGRCRPRPCCCWPPGWPRGCAPFTTRGWCTGISTLRTSCWATTGRGSRGSGLLLLLARMCRRRGTWRLGTWRRSRRWDRTRGRRATFSAWVRCWCTRLADKGRSAPGRVLCSCTGWSTARLTSAGCRVNCGRWWAGAWPSSRIAGRRRASWWRSYRLRLCRLLWRRLLWRRLLWRGWPRVSRRGAGAGLRDAAGPGRGARRGSPPGWWPPAPRWSSC